MKKNLHNKLWKACKKLPNDYEPYGNTIRWDKDPKIGADCSCGCEFFIELNGELGLDWGICLNQKSHRYGLLTFEHQGCANIGRRKPD